MLARLLLSMWRAAMVTLRVLWRVTRQLFHEATGALFAVFAAYGAFAAWRQWKYHPAQWQWITGIAVVYAIMMAAFSLGAFRRARRVR